MHKLRASMPKRTLPAPSRNVIRLAARTKNDCVLFRAATSGPYRLTRLRDSCNSGVATPDHTSTGKLELVRKLPVTVWGYRQPCQYAGSGTKAIPSFTAISELVPTTGSPQALSLPNPAEHLPANWRPPRFKFRLGGRPVPVRGSGVDRFRLEGRGSTGSG